MYSNTHKSGSEKVEKSQKKGALLAETHYLLWLVGTILTDMSDLAAFMTLFADLGLSFGPGRTGTFLADSLGGVSGWLSELVTLTYCDHGSGWTKSNVICHARVDLSVASRVGHVTAERCDGTEEGGISARVIVEFFSVGYKAAENVGLFKEIERLHGLLLVILSLLNEIFDLDLHGAAGVVMIPVIDDAGLEFAWAIFIDYIIDDGGVLLAGPEDLDLFSS
jgi:hypothetical protein